MILFSLTDCDSGKSTKNVKSSDCYRHGNNVNEINYTVTAMRTVKKNISILKLLLQAIASNSNVQLEVDWK